MKTANQVVILALCSALCLSAAPIFTNGNFESGNTGFNTNYGFVAVPPGNLTAPAVYSVISNPQTGHPAWASFGDHTTGSGLMMVVNGDITAGTLVWSETVTLTPGATYQMQFWGASTYFQNPATLNVQVNGVGIGTPLQLSGTTGQWLSFTANFVAPSSSVTVAIHDPNTDFTGNDFVLDDISLTEMATPEPASVALFGLGLAGLWLVRRRH